LYLHEAERGAASNEVLREVCGAALAVAQRIHEDLGGVAHGGVGLLVVALESGQVANQEDVVPTAPECSREVNPVVMTSQLDSIPPT
jgi:hypothetical protein